MRPLLSLAEPRAQPYLVADPLPRTMQLELFPNGAIIDNKNWSTKLYHTWHVLNTSRSQINELTVQAGWHLLDVYSLSSLRPDAHVSSTDCLHFCLPGPINAWAAQLVTLLYEIIGEEDSTHKRKIYN